MDHLGVEVDTTEAVHAATTRLSTAGPATAEADNTACCNALQDKVWVHGPGQEPWEVYVVKADADSLSKQHGSTCCFSPAAADAGANEPVAASGCCWPPDEDLHSSRAATGAGDRSRPRAALPRPPTGP